MYWCMHLCACYEFSNSCVKTCAQNLLQTATAGIDLGQPSCYGSLKNWCIAWWHSGRDYDEHYEQDEQSDIGYATHISGIFVQGGAKVIARFWLALILWYDWKMTVRIRIEGHQFGPDFHNFPLLLLELLDIWIIASNFKSPTRENVHFGANK